MPQVRRKKLRPHDGAREDRISKLPDHLLLCILELMDSREAVATAALSKRWRHVWRSLTKFNFDVRDMVHPRYHRLRKVLLRSNRALRSSRSSRQLHIRSSINVIRRTLKKYKQRAMREFLKSVSRFLSSNDSLNVRSLHLNFFTGAKYASSIDRLVGMAVGENTEDLEIQMLDEVSSEEKSYTFPIWLFSNGRGSSLTKLSVGGCKLQTPPEFHGFDSITELSLVGVHLEDEHISNLLCSCRHLESLLLDNCRGFELVDISLSVSSLKYLTIHNCCIDKIQICSTKLQKLEYQGDFIPLTFEHTPRLEHLELAYYDVHRGTEYMLGKLSRDHPQVTTLHLSFGEPRTWIMPKDLPAPFWKLKVLYLTLSTHETANLLWMSLLLEAAPILETLSIVLKLEEKTRSARTVWHPSNFRHSCLETVVIHLFRGMQNEIDFGRFVLERAVHLKFLLFASEAQFEKILGSYNLKAFRALPRSPKDRAKLLKQLTAGISTDAQIVMQ